MVGVLAVGQQGSPLYLSKFIYRLKDSNMQEKTVIFNAKKSENLTLSVSPINAPSYDLPSNNHTRFFAVVLPNCVGD